MRQKGGARCLCLATQCSCSGQRVGVAKRGNPVKEAEPDHVDRRFKFVSRWSFPDQRWNKNKKSWLASCWPESVFLCLGPPSLLQPYWGCWTIPQILPPHWLEVVCHLNPTSRLAGLCSMVPQLWKRRRNEISNRAFFHPCFTQYSASSSVNQRGGVDL